MMQKIRTDSFIKLWSMPLPQQVKGAEEQVSKDQHTGAEGVGVGAVQ